MYLEPRRTDRSPIHSMARSRRITVHTRTPMAMYEWHLFLDPSNF